jgi:hypothetical protein
VNGEDVEVAFINVCDAYAEKFGELPVVLELRDDYGYEEEEESANHDPDIKTSPPIVNNLEPLCFL